jgi:HemY protein
MIRLILLLVAGGAIAVGAAWLADHDGIFLLTMNGYEVRTSAGFAVFLLLLTAALLLLLLRLVFLLLRSPDRFGSFFSARRGRKAYQALSQGLVAAASGDTGEAVLQARRSERLAGVEPLALLLQAQAAQLSGQDDRQETLYRAMLDVPETEFLGLRGLYALAMRRRDPDEALALLVRAQTLRPKAAWGLSALFDMRVARREWREAQTLLAQAAQAKLVTADIANRRRGVLIAAQAQDADGAGDAQGALVLAFEAVALAPGLTVAALIAVRPLAEQGRSWKAQDIIEAAWTQAPHPDLATAYGAIRPGDDRETRAKRLAGLAQLNPMHRESRILAAEQGIARRRWTEARAILDLLVRDLPTRRLCLLMADIAQGEGDHATAQSWRTSSMRAPEDARWHCAQCGVPAQSWSALCLHCGAFDSLAWTLQDQSAHGSSAVLLPSPTLSPTLAPTLAPENPAPFFRPPHDPAPALDPDFFDEDKRTSLAAGPQPG